MDYHTYQSPYTWRYASDEMRRLWSEEHKRKLWRQVWVALAEVQSEFGLVSPAEAADLRAHMTAVDMPRALEIEAEIHHDLMAELRTFAAQSPVGGRVLHLGATSMDIEDNAEALRLRRGLDLILAKLRRLVARFADLIEQWADVPVMAYTHLQPAEPITLGYRLALYAQDLWMDWEDLSRTRRLLRGKGFKGAVGSGASYGELIGTARLGEFEARLAAHLGLPFFSVTAQVYPRKQDYRILCALAGLAGSLYKFAFDLRVLQTPAIGELAEPFGSRQVGSSAMPFKRNPIRAEKLDSLGRMLAQMPRLAWDNAAHSLLERTLDNSANRRTILPESFLIADEMLSVTGSILEGLQVDQAAIERNMDTYGPFAATERILMALTRAGADRQEMHERLRLHSLHAWQVLQSGGANPLQDVIAADSQIAAYFTPDEVSALMEVDTHLGDAPQRARALASALRQEI